MSEVITGEIKGITKIDSKVEFIEDIMSFLGNEANFKTDGVFEIGKVKAIIMTIEKNHTKSELNKLEVHENYHDLHVTLEGKDNIVVFYTDRYKDQPMLVKGAGAGAEVTASGIFADIIRIGKS
jgi:aspartokinase/homoserine dehydrogenase 1